MSFGICRVQKIKGAAGVVGLQLHNRREREHSNSNPDIDRSRSALNYSLTDNRTMNYNKLIDERLKQAYKGKKAIRKDAVRMCEMLFTSDGEFFSRISEQEQRQFFLDCFEFAAQRYGRENIIAATVHLDEATPHLHLDFVPLTPDGRLSAKEVFGNRPQLQQLQDDFFSAVSSKYGLERGQRADIENKERPRKHLETADYKEKIAKERTQRAEQVIQSANQRIQEVEQEQRAAEQHLQDLKGKVLKAEEVNRINGKKSITGALKGITYEDYLNLKATAARVEKADEIINNANKIIADAQSEVADKLASVVFYKIRLDHLKEEFADQQKKNEEQSQQSEEKLSSIQAQISELQKQVAEYEKQKAALQRDLEEYQKALDELKQNEDERYGYMQVSARVFKELFEKAKENKVSFQAKKEDEDNSYIIQTPKSEEPYLAAAVADIKKRIQGDSQAPRNAPRLRR